MREEIMMVLRMLKEGKITVAEAERLLSVLQREPETERTEDRRPTGAVDMGLWAARRSAKAAAKRARELLSQIDAEKYVSQAMRQLDEALKQVDRVIRDIEPGKRVQEIVTRMRQHPEEAEQHVRQDIEVGTREETITFPEGEIDQLQVLTPVGNIRARSAEGGLVTVKVSLRAEGTDADDAAARLAEMRVEARRVDGRAEVAVRGRDDAFPEGCRADVE
ncbi:MAG: SHOCT-like domain-containing protein, partial [Armatimonadota bacterium]